MSEKMNENEINKQPNSAERAKDKEMFNGVIFPMDFFNPDGSYIPVTESYREAIMRKITTGRIAATPEMIAQLSPTPEEVAAMQQCRQNFGTMMSAHNNDVLSAIALCRDEIGTSYHELAMKVLGTYGICLLFALITEYV